MEITKSIDDLKNAFTSTTCELSFSEKDNLIPTDNSDVDGFYDKYYGFCRFLCGCRSNAAAVTTNVKREHFTTEGECNSVAGSLQEINEQMDSALSCIGTSGIRDYFDFFCEAPRYNLRNLGKVTSPDEEVSICAGYYEECCDHSFCRRRVLDGEYHLEEIESLTNEDSMEKVASLGGNPDGVYVQKNDMLTEDSCQKLIDFIDQEPEERIFAGEHVGLNRPLTGEELIDIVGKNEAKHLLEFFHESIGAKVPVTKIKIQNTDNKVLGVYTGHVDKVDTMITFLNKNYDNDVLNGGGLYHHTRTGLMKAEKVTPGLTIVHGNDVIHDTFPWKGPRYILDIGHDPHVENPSCMLSNLVD